MDKDKLNEIQTLIDGINFDLQDLRDATAKIEERLRELTQALSAKELNEF